MSKKGFTLIELLAVVAILVIMTLGVVPNLVQTYNKAKDKEYEEFIERLKESARVYAEHNIDDIEGFSEIEGTAYVTIRDIVDEGLLRLPLINPRTKESVDLNSQIKIIRISNNSFDIELFVIPDRTPPVITLNGSSTVNIFFRAEYTELGATAIDDVDGDISHKIEIIGEVNTDIVGTYIITYRVKDNSGNVAEVTRKVVVYVGIPPGEEM